jgi:predicted transport protein
MCELFQCFRKEVLAIDPCVREAFLRRYVAYKADIDFVDLIPQSRGFCLFLNMPFAEIIDPRGRCEDMSTTGHWGNGDVEVSLVSLDELPYVIGLIRQSFERQMGDAPDT